MTSPAPLHQNEKDKQRVLNRLRRIEGQVRGLHKMIEEERPCQEVLTLLSGIRSALNSTSEVVFTQYLNSCVADAGDLLSTEAIVKTARLLR